MLPKLDRFFWLLLIIGVALRCVALNQPLVDAHSIRQCHTAFTTESLLEQRGFNLSAKIPWSGDIDARYIIEFPLFNYLVMGMHRLVGDLDRSGKIMSIALWTASFFCLQFIWRRLLDWQQTNWANLLFVFAPLSVFYGQAFMPEMLVQFLAFAFVLLVFRYDEMPTLARWISCAAVGLLALLIKLPEIAHLYLILAVLVFRREGIRALIRPRYLIAAAAAIVMLKAWGSYMDTINIDPSAFGSSKEHLRVFIGTWGDRLQIVRWVMVCLYISVFIFSGPAVLIAAFGLWIFIREQPKSILGLWLLSLPIFYLVWFGNTAANQSYYNLVALAPLCALFGIGTSAVLAWRTIRQWRRVAVAAAALLVMLPAIPVYRYLFRKDRIILAAARWVRDNTQPHDLILFRPNHSSSMIDYPYNPIMRYYGKRLIFLWTNNMPEFHRKAALERANYAVVTLPQPPVSGLLGMLNRFRHFDRSPESMDWLESSGFRIVVRQNAFLVYARNSL